MGSRDPRIDAYIARSAAFAQPILTHLRDTVHAACPTVEETIKWGAPSFTVDGRILCIMAAFKRHCALNLWRGEEIFGKDAEGAMGQFGRIVSVDDLPPRRTLVGCLKKAAARHAAGKRPAPRKPARPEAEVPPSLAAALKKHAAARRHFEAFAPGQRREYIEWINGARREETRDRRLATTIEWLAEGRTRNWKYDKC